MTKFTASLRDTDEQLIILQKRLNLEVIKGNLIERYWRLTEIIQPVIQKNPNKNFTLFMDNGQLFAQIEGQFEDAIRNTEEAIK